MLPIPEELFEERIIETEESMKTQWEFWPQFEVYILNNISTDSGCGNSQDHGHTSLAKDFRATLGLPQ